MCVCVCVVCTRTEIDQIWLRGNGGPRIHVCPGRVQPRVQICFTEATKEEGSQTQH